MKPNAALEELARQRIIGDPADWSVVEQHPAAVDPHGSEAVVKYNENHDEHGRFTDGAGNGATVGELTGSHVDDATRAAVEAALRDSSLPPESKALLEGMLRGPQEQSGVLYHGTSSAYLESISQNGLTISGNDRNWAGSLYEGDRGESVYLADNLTNASEWAQTAMLATHASSAAVLEVHLPKGSELLADKGEQHAFRYTSNIPPDWIKSVRLVNPGQPIGEPHPLHKAADDVVFATALFALADAAKLVKYNENHDEHGRFASGDGASGSAIDVRTDEGKATRNADREEYARLGEQMTADYSAQEKTAIARYSGTDVAAAKAMEVNNGLRGNAAITEAGQKTSDDLDRAFEHSTTPEKVEVARGMMLPSAVFGTDDLASLKGTEFTDRGFVSTSMDRTVAGSFAQWSGGAIMAIEVPKGSSAIHVGSAVGGTQESELILPRGSSFAITGVAKDAISYTNALGTTTKLTLIQARYIGSSKTASAAAHALTIMAEDDRFTWSPGDIIIDNAALAQLQHPALKAGGTALSKYNENHDEHGRFATGEGGTQYRVDYQHRDGSRTASFTVHASNPTEAAQIARENLRGQGGWSRTGVTAVQGEAHPATAATQTGTSTPAAAAPKEPSAEPPSDRLTWKTSEDVKEGFEQNHGIKLRQGDGVSNKAFMARATQMDATLHDLKDRFPAADKSLRTMASGGGVLRNGISVERPGSFYLGSGQKGVNGTQSNERGAIFIIDSNRAAEGSIAKGSWTIGGNSVGSTLRHELGHAVEAQHLQGLGNDVFGGLNAVGAKSFREIKDNVAKNLTRYGSTNAQEWYAESFSAYTHPGYAGSNVKVNVALARGFKRVLGA